MIRVFVCANSAVELAGLEALVKSAPSLKLAGSSLAGLGQAGPRQELGQAEADVLLERPRFDESFASSPEPEAPDFADLDARPPARVWLVAEAEFAAAAAALRDSTVRGVLPAWASAKQIQAAVEAAAAGLVVLHPEVAGRLGMGRGALGRSGASRAGTEVTPLASAPDEPLSPRESEVLNLLAAGLANKQIAWRLKISEHTVKFHVTSIFNKLGASSRAEAVVLGVRRGLIVL
ncbi:MAG TPA: response regulator transcription factor [Terriglobia bacterium]